jgi:hypothetical protein
MANTRLAGRSMSTERDTCTTRGRSNPPTVSSTATATTPKIIFLNIALLARLLPLADRGPRLSAPSASSISPTALCT